ncbi:hypothetical protein [Chitinophaga sp.]|uniref:hypothetical protein n=1 Tax=Chitinophaga sp. TaxID=1869181 RepID=UPI002F924B91
MAGPDVNPVYPPGTNPQDTSTTVTPPTGTAKIEGTWNFVGVTVKSTTSQKEGVATMKSISEYTTSDNEGVFVFDGKNITITGLSYTISGTMKVTVSAPGIPTTEIPYPIMEIMPSYDGVSPYKSTGGNKIHMDEGFIGDPTGTGVTPTQGADATVLVDGDNLTMTIDLSQMAVPGVQVSGTQVAKFTRKK